MFLAQISAFTAEILGPDDATGRTRLWMELHLTHTHTHTLRENSLPATDHSVVMKEALIPQRQMTLRTVGICDKRNKVNLSE